MEIKLVNLSKRFGNVTAVDDISLRIPPGEFIVLVGPSGCGKTTLLRMLAGLTEPSSGLIRFDSSDITAQSPAQRNVAMVFQNYALFPHMTVERNLSFGMRLRRVVARERQQRVQDVARLLQVEDLLTRYPRELSGGQKQRVALGRALIRRPVAFLFDEPLSNLDPALRVEMRAEIAQLHHRYPVTTVYVTHDQIEAMTMGNRIAIMHEGRILQVGSPQQVYHDPDNVFTAGFIGSPAMNQIAMSLTDAARDLTLASDEGFSLSFPQTHVTWTPKLPSQVILGVRPEHLQLCQPQTPNAFAATVTLVEELGREHIVHLSRGALNLRAVATGEDTPALSEDIYVTPDSQHLYLFDAGTGVRLRA